MLTLFVELISILVNASMYFNYDYDFIFFVKHMLRLGILEVKY